MGNTVAGVNLAAIAEESLPALQSLFAPLAALTTDFSTEIKDKGESVTTRYPTKPTAQDLAGGYTATDVVMTAKTVTLNTFYGFVYGFLDAERSKSSVVLNDLFIQPALQAVGDKVFGDVWNLVSVANFATATAAITASNFTRNDLVDIGVTLTATKKAPRENRSCLLAPGHYGGIVKTLNSAEFPGVSEMKAEAMAPRTAKFNLYESDRCDDNAENLAGFAFHKTSLLMAARGVDATGFAQVGELADVTIPGLGLPVQFRRWYNPDLGMLLYSMGVLYGVAKGQDFGVRIVSA